MIRQRPCSDPPLASVRLVELLPKKGSPPSLSGFCCSKPGNFLQGVLPGWNQRLTLMPVLSLALGKDWARAINKGVGVCLMMGRGSGVQATQR